MANKKEEDKLRTCADCKYHYCKNKCVTHRYGCNGYCYKNKVLRKCDSNACKYYVIDKFFVR